MSKLIMLEYSCSQHGVFEKLDPPLSLSAKCPVCNKTSSKIISKPRINLEGWSLSFPTAADRWARNHKEAAKVAREREDP